MDTVHNTGKLQAINSFPLTIVEEQTRGSVRRASGFVQIAISLTDPGSAATSILAVIAMGTRLDRKELEKLREAKRSRGFWRLDSSETIEYEFKGQFGHPSSYAYVRFECLPADDLSFEVQASWPSTVSGGYDKKLEQAVAEGVADVLLAEVLQHFGCKVVLSDVRYDEIGSSEAAFMKAATFAMRSLLSKKWTPIGKRSEQA